MEQVVEKRTHLHIKMKLITLKLGIICSICENYPAIFGIGETDDNPKTYLCHECLINLFSNYKGATDGKSGSIVQQNA